MLAVAANTLFFLGQNQFNTFSYNICPCFSMLFTVRLNPFVGHCINAGFHFNAFRVL